MLKGKIEVLFGHLKKKVFGKKNPFMCYASSLQLVLAKFSKPLWNAFGFQITHSQNQNRPKSQNTSPDFGYMVQKCMTKL